MDKKLLKKILRNKQLFVPIIFTEKQFGVLEKYTQNKQLSNAEKKALYTSITKKMKALESIKIEKDNEYYINGAAKIIPERLKKAKEIIDGYSKRYEKVFISGSFLFSKEFNDIDIFIIREKGYKEDYNDNEHIIFLTEKKLSNPVFQSAAMISVANFILPTKMIIKKPKLGIIMSTYHEAVIEKMQNDKPDMIRHFLFDYYWFCKGKLVDGKQLIQLSNTVSLSDLDFFIKELCKRLFSKKYLYVDIHEYIKTLKDTIKTEKPIEHLIRYINTYEELIYGRRRSKAKAA